MRLDDPKDLGATRGVSSLAERRDHTRRDFSEAAQVIQAYIYGASKKKKKAIVGH